MEEVSQQGIFAQKRFKIAQGFFYVTSELNYIEELIKIK